jgi:hypothetical protein
MPVDVGALWGGSNCSFATLSIGQRIGKNPKRWAFADAS